MADIGTFAGVGVVTVALLPVPALLVWVLARRRGATAWRLSLAEVGLVYGTLPWVWMILLPGSQAGARVSLVPLRDLIAVLADEPVTATLMPPSLPHVGWRCRAAAQDIRTAFIRAGPPLNRVELAERGEVGEITAKGGARSWLSCSFVHDHGQG